ncbi:MAG: HEAT repeat domain-containing protein [Nitrospinae bacterium]|nr:HEAT repeat domain-containing protein [Nitrospinota bacterium]
MKSISRLLIIAAALLTAIPALAADGAKDKLLALFSDRHYVADEQAIKNTGPDAAEALKQIAADPEVIIFKRVRAIDALGYFTDGKTTEYLKSAAVSTAEDQPSLRWGAIQALGRSQGDGATDFIAKTLKGSDQLTKQVSINTLRKIGSEKAARALREAGVEK